ncbi:MAG: hypothetical protein E7671_01740 [Ruminococcaceae bacterium]|nr:hypothetical protein [Oscillospiraceae bacterium]
MLVMSVSAVDPDTAVYTADQTEWTIDTATGIVTVNVSASNTSGEAFLDDYNNGAWKTFLADNKAVITEVRFENVEGRTDITVLKAGIPGLTNLTKIVYPETVTKPIARSAGGWAYTSNPKLRTFGPVGTATGTCDLSTISMSYAATDATLGYLGTSWTYQSGYGYRFAFNGAAFTKVIFPENAIAVPQQMFGNNTKLTEVVFNNAIGYIYANAFLGCTGLTDVKLYANPSIDATAFSGCSNLNLHVIEDSAAHTSADTNGTYFAVSLVKYDVETSTALDSNVYMAAYEIWEKDGIYFVIYTDYEFNDTTYGQNGETSLYKMCKFAVAANAELAGNAIIKPIIDKFTA